MTPGKDLQIHAFTGVPLPSLHLIDRCVRIYIADKSGHLAGHPHIRRTSIFLYGLVIAAYDWQYQTEQFLVCQDSRIGSAE